MTYAHHGRIRCYTWRRSTLGAAQRWDSYCKCGWRTENQPDWPCAYWALVQHQTDLEPEWVVWHTPLQRAHNEGIRA